MALLEVRGLEKWYGRRQVVNGVEFDVNRGEVVGLLGPNGAGKTTSFRMTIGLIDADGGKVIFDGQDVTNLPMYQRARSGMGYLAQDSSVFKQLTVEDNLMAILETRPGMNRKQRKERQNELLDQFGLAKIRKTRANRVSGGERRRLEIARSLITDPKLIMLDEPFAGIDPKTVAEIQDQIRNLVETYNIGILLTDHQFRETLEVTDRAYLIREGRVFAYGNSEQIINNPEVRKYYIGERYDFGHLLDKRHPHSIADGKADPGVAIPAVAEPAPEPSAIVDAAPPPGPEAVFVDETGPARATPPIPAPAPVEDVARPASFGVEVVADGFAQLRRDGSGFAADRDAGHHAWSGATPEPAGPREAEPPRLPDYHEIERFLGGSVTILGNVVFEQLDVATEARPADGDGDPGPGPIGPAARIDDYDFLD